MGWGVPGEGAYHKATIAYGFQSKTEMIWGPSIVQNNLPPPVPITEAETSCVIRLHKKLFYEDIFGCFNF